MRIMRETHAPDAVSLKTAYSGVKFEILISKKPIQFRPAYNQLTDRQTNQPTNPLDFCIPPFPPLSFPLGAGVFSFLPFFFRTPALMPERRGDEIRRLLKSLKRFN